MRHFAEIDFEMIIWHLLHDARLKKMGSQNGSSLFFRNPLQDCVNCFVTPLWHEYKHTHTYTHTHTHTHSGQTTQVFPDPNDPNTFSQWKWLNVKIASGGWSSDTKHVLKTLVVMSWQQYVIWHTNTSYDTFNCVVKKMSHKCQLKAFEVNKGLWNLLSQMIPLLINIISNAHCFENIFTH